MLCRHDKGEWFQSHLTQKQDHGTIAGPPNRNGRRTKGYPKLHVLLEMKDERKKQAELHATALSVIAQRQTKRARNVRNPRSLE